MCCGLTFFSGNLYTSVSLPSIRMLVLGYISSVTIIFLSEILFDCWLCDVFRGEFDSATSIVCLISPSAVASLYLTVLAIHIFSLIRYDI